MVGVDWTILWTPTSPLRSRCESPRLPMKDSRARFILIWRYRFQRTTTLTRSADLHLGGAGSATPSSSLPKPTTLLWACHNGRSGSEIRTRYSWGRLGVSSLLAWGITLGYVGGRSRIGNFAMPDVEQSDVYGRVLLPSWCCASDLTRDTTCAQPGDVARRA